VFFFEKKVPENFCTFVINQTAKSFLLPLLKKEGRPAYSCTASANSFCKTRAAGAGDLNSRLAAA